MNQEIQTTLSNAFNKLLEDHIPDVEDVLSTAAEYELVDALEEQGYDWNQVVEESELYKDSLDKVEELEEENKKLKKENEVVIAEAVAEDHAQLAFRRRLEEEIEELKKKNEESKRKVDKFDKLMVLVKEIAYEWWGFAGTGVD